MKTKIEIIDETVEYYSVPGRRSLNPDWVPEIDGAKCLYMGPNGERCAFSRVVSNPEELKENECAAEQMGVAIFMPEYEGHDGGFWNDVQSIHDDEHWNQDGSLDPKGFALVARLKAKYTTSPSTE